MIRTGTLIEKFDHMDATAIIDHFGWKTSAVNNKNTASIPVIAPQREPTDVELAFLR